MDDYNDIVKRLEYVKTFPCSKMELDIVMQHAIDYLHSIAPIEVHPFGSTPCSGYLIYHAKCPKCNAMINSTDNKACCGRCGQRLIWN